MTTLEPLAIVAPPDMGAAGLAAWQGEVDGIIDMFQYERCELCGDEDAGGDLNEHIIAPGPFSEARAVCLLELVEHAVGELIAAARSDVAEHLGLDGDLPALASVIDRLIAWRRLVDVDGVLVCGDGG